MFHTPTRLCVTRVTRFEGRQVVTYTQRGCCRASIFVVLTCYRAAGEPEQACPSGAASADAFFCSACDSFLLAPVMTVRVAVTQKLRERIPSIAAVQLVN